jgi:hypothetical protein
MQTPPIDHTALRTAIDVAVDPQADPSFYNLRHFDRAGEVRDEVYLALDRVFARSLPSTRIEDARDALDAAMNPHDGGDNDPLRPLEIRAILLLRDRVWAGVYPMLAAGLQPEYRGSPEPRPWPPKWDILG